MFLSFSKRKTCVYLEEYKVKRMKKYNFNIITDNIHNFKNTFTNIYIHTSYNKTYNLML